MNHGRCQIKPFILKSSRNPGVPLKASSNGHMLAQKANPEHQGSALLNFYTFSVKGLGPAVWLSLERLLRRLGPPGPQEVSPASTTAMKSPSKFLSCFICDDAVAVFWLPPRPAVFAQSLSRLQDMLKSVTISQVSHSIQAGDLRLLRTHLLIGTLHAGVG